MTLDDDTLVSGGTLSISGNGELDITTGALGAGHGATLSGVAVTNGNIEVDPAASGAVLTLEGNASITDAGLFIGADDQVVVGGGNGSDAPDATLDSVEVDGQPGAIVVGANSTLLIAGLVALENGGTVELQTATEQFAAVITGDVNHVLAVGTLDNITDTIEGTGTIGIGDQTIAFDNQSGGTVDAGAGDALTLNTGLTVGNAGVLAASNGGELRIDDELNNVGTLEAISGGTLNVWVR